MVSFKALALLCLVYISFATAANGFDILTARRAVLQSPTTSTTTMATGGTATVSASGQATGGRGSVATQVIVRQGPSTPSDPLRDELVDTVAEAIDDVENGQSAKTVAEEMAVAYAISVSETQADVIVEQLKEGDKCSDGFEDPVKTATPFARTLVEVLANASTFIAFEDTDAAIAKIAEVTGAVFADTEALACEIGDDVTALAESLTAGLTEPYEEVMRFAFIAVAGEREDDVIAFSVSSNALDGSFIDLAMAPGSMEEAEDFVEILPALEESFPPCGSRFRGCCFAERNKCRCGGSCEAIPYEFDNSAFFGYEVTVSSTLGPSEGEICLCS